MTEIKKRTLFDKCRDAYRAFRGKQIGSLTFGIDIKKCSECDYKSMSQSDVLYVFDQKACSYCSYPLCNHTTDIRHAVNFRRDCDFFKEIDDIYETGESL